MCVCVRARVAGEKSKVKKRESEFFLSLSCVSAAVFCLQKNEFRVYCFFLQLFSAFSAQFAQKKKMHQKQHFFIYIERVGVGEHIYTRVKTRARRSEK